MSLVRTPKAEFSDMFRPFFEDCPPELERAASVMSDGSPNPFLAGNLSETSATNGPVDRIGSTTFMNLDPLNPKIQELVPNIYDLCKTVASDFYAHTRDPYDYEVKSVYLLRNPVVWSRYQAEKKLRRALIQEHNTALAQAGTPVPPTSVDDDPEQLFRDEVLFHGTQQHKLSSILTNGLDPKMTVRANYGKGCYFSDTIEKCMQYVDIQRTVDQEYSIILCCVLLGKVMIEPHDRSKRVLSPQTVFLPDGYSSAMAHDVYKEWVVFEKSQILPLCVINFKASNKPESHYRLSQFSVVFKRSTPSNVGDIPRVCTVPTPVDKNKKLQEGDMEKSREWREPDAPTAKMLRNIFGIEKAQICHIHFPTWMEWVVSAKNGVGEDAIGYLSNKDMMALVELSKNIDLHQERLEVDMVRKRLENDQKTATIINLSSHIPNGPNIIRLVAERWQIQDQIDAVKKHILSVNTQLKQSGREHLISSPQYQAELSPYQHEWDSLYAEYALRDSQLSTCDRAVVAAAEAVVGLQRELDLKTKEDSASLERQLNTINALRERSKERAKHCTTAITREDLERRFAVAKEQFNTALMSKTLQENFEMVDSQVTTSSTESWPLIVAEMLLPPIMFTLMTPEDRGFMSRTKILSRQQDWWNHAHLAVFRISPPSHKFWPLDPRRRLPNRRFLQLKDYIEWIFLEKENRIRKRNWRQNQTLSQPPADMLQNEGDADIRGYLEQQWELLDPTVIKSIGELSSRNGRVSFNREKRQKELDETGASLLSELFVPAESNMLIRDASSSTQGDAECPICQDVLEIPDPTKSASQASTSQEPELVVKLKSCRHCFHEACIKEWFKSKDAQLKCPMCNTMCTTEAKSGVAKRMINSQGPQKLGPMPDGVMAYHFDVRLSCYFIYIVMPGHTIPNTNSTQTPNSSSNPSTIHVPTDVRYAILPVSGRLGPLLLIRLIALFYYGHMFRVGRSLTRGTDNVVVWNGVHLRTTMRGEYGFPAPHFESNCWDEINQKGVAMGLDELILSMLNADGSEPALLHDDTQVTSGVNLPTSVLEEMSSQALTTRLFHNDRPLLFRD
ncbi:hypothetical protein B0O80DRAFT_499069 [Mortierella sp. GBAus27b]|nr:putative E3 ubiquitin-protein ligase dtx2 [Mortierella sp. GBA43]KAI8352987.1 hypothetical protein B0O80DRAFT_499069 [Mortierella sp. GBAus27b]